MVRWGAILYTDINDPDYINFIEKVIGDDLLNMEEKEKLINKIKDTKDNKKIIQEWMVIENNRLREENVIKTAREDGAENKRLEVIKNMLLKGTDYEYISEITSKTIREIKEVEKNMINKK